MGNTNIHVTVDKDLCIGCGSCARTAPELFEIGEDMKSRVREGAPMDVDRALETAKNCPVGAIIIADA